MLFEFNLKKLLAIGVIAVSIVACQSEVGSEKATNSVKNTNLTRTDCPYPNETCGIPELSIDGATHGAHQRDNPATPYGNYIGNDIPLLMEFRNDLLDWTMKDYVLGTFSASNYNYKNHSAKFVDVSPESGCISRIVKKGETCYVYGIFHLDLEDMNYNKRPLYNFAGRLYNVFAYSPQHDGAVLAQFPIMVSPHQTVQSIRRVLPIESQYYTPELNKDKKSYQIIQVQNLSYMESDLIINKIKLESNLNDVFMLQHKTLAKNDPIYGDYTECATAETADGILKVATLHQAQKCLLIYKAKATAEKAGTIMDRLSIETNATASPNYSPQKVMEGYYMDVLKPDLRLKAEYKESGDRTPVGSVWIASSTRNMGFLTSISYGGGMLIAFNSSGNVFKSIDGGNNWMLISNISGASDVVSAYGNGVFVLPIDINSGKHAWVSTNGGLNWTDTLLSSGYGNLRSVIFINNCFIGVGNGNSIKSCDNGKTWVSSNIDGLAKYDLTSGNNMLIAVGEAGNIWRSLDNGNTWTVKNVFSSSYAFSRIAYGKGVFVSLEMTRDRSKSSEIWRSLDNGLTWDRVFVNNASYFSSIVFSDGYFIVTDYNGVVYYSADSGATWTRSKTDKMGELRQVVSIGGDKFVAVNKEGMAYYSTISTTSNGILNNFSIYY